MTQGKHFAAGGDHFAALPSKKIHTPKGIARLTVTAATMAAMTGSSLISPFTAFAQTGDGGTQHPAVMSQRARTPPMPPARTSSRRRRVSQTPRRMRPRRTKRTSPPSRRPRMPRTPSIRPRQMP